MSDQSALLAALRPFADATFALTSEGNVLAFDTGFEERTGWTPEQWLGRPMAELAHPDDGAAVRAALARVMEDQTPTVFEVRLCCRNGGHLVAECSLAPAVRNAAVTGAVGVLRDVTARKDDEEGLLQAQRTELVGRLATGAAHYFNNLMTTVLGFSELLLDALPANHSHRPGVEEIHKAGRQAAAIAAQLLAFGRKQIPRPEVLNLNDVITEAATLSQTLLGGKCHLRTAVDPEPLQVEADTNQLKQVFLTLLLNARDALMQGSKLLVATARIDVDLALADTLTDLTPGPWVAVVVRGTGPGIEEPTTERLLTSVFRSRDSAMDVPRELTLAADLLRQNRGRLVGFSRTACEVTFAILLSPVHEAVPALV